MIKHKRGKRVPPQSRCREEESDTPTSREHIRSCATSSDEGEVPARGRPTNALMSRSYEPPRVVVRVTRQSCRAKSVFDSIPVSAVAEPSSDPESSGRSRVSTRSASAEVPASRKTRLQVGGLRSALEPLVSREKCLPVRGLRSAREVLEGSEVEAIRSSRLQVGGLRSALEPFVSREKRLKMRGLRSTREGAEDSEVESKRCSQLQVGVLRSDEPPRGREKRLEVRGPLPVSEELDDSEDESIRSPGLQDRGLRLARTGVDSMTYREKKQARGSWVVPEVVGNGEAEHLRYREKTSRYQVQVAGSREKRPCLHPRGLRSIHDSDVESQHLLRMVDDTEEEPDRGIERHSLAVREMTNCSEEDSLADIESEHDSMDEHEIKKMQPKVLRSAGSGFVFSLDGVMKKGQMDVRGLRPAGDLNNASEEEPVAEPEIQKVQVKGLRSAGEVVDDGEMDLSVDHVIKKRRVEVRNLQSVGGLYEECLQARNLQSARLPVAPRGQAASFSRPTVGWQASDDSEGRMFSGMRGQRPVEASTRMTPSGRALPKRSYWHLLEEPSDASPSEDEWGEHWQTQSGSFPRRSNKSFRHPVENSATWDGVDDGSVRPRMDLPASMRMVKHYTSRYLTSPRAHQKTNPPQENPTE